MVTEAAHVAPVLAVPTRPHAVVSADSPRATRHEGTRRYRAGAGTAGEDTVWHLGRAPVSGGRGASASSGASHRVPRLQRAQPLPAAPGEGGGSAPRRPGSRPERAGKRRKPHLGAGVPAGHPKPATPCSPRLPAPGASEERGTRAVTARAPAGFRRGARCLAAAGSSLSV